MEGQAGCSSPLPEHCPPAQEQGGKSQHHLLPDAASGADGDLGCSSASLGQQQSLASSPDTASLLSSAGSHSLEDSPPSSSHEGPKVRDLPPAQHHGLGKGIQGCLPSAPWFGPLTMTSVTQQASGPLTGEADGPSGSPRHFSKRKLPAFAPEVTGNSPSGAKGQATGETGAHPHPVPAPHRCLSHQECERGEEPTSPCPMYQLVLAGDRGMGKSSFLMCLCANEFREDISSTLGSTPSTLGTQLGQGHRSSTCLSLPAGVDLQIKQLLVDGEQTTLQIWDTAGQER